MGLPEIEIHPAHVWDCDACGSENFERGIVVEPSEEDVQAIAEEVGEYQKGFWMMCPDPVTCRNCGAKFNIQHMQDDEGEELE
jgi:hypothetical protein